MLWALAASGLDNNLYVQVGLVLLMALSAKNAILIVELARELRAGGVSIRDAAVEAARARLRPILMTSLAFIFGVLPLVLASGAGASARQSIGVTVFTGTIASTCLAVLFVPAFFVLVQHFEEWLRGAQEIDGRRRHGGVAADLSGSATTRASPDLVDDAHVAVAGCARFGRNPGQPDNRQHLVRFLGHNLDAGVRKVVGRVVTVSKYRWLVLLASWRRSRSPWWRLRAR